MNSIQSLPAVYPIWQVGDIYLFINCTKQINKHTNTETYPIIISALLYYGYQIWAAQIQSTTNGSKYSFLYLFIYLYSFAAQSFAALSYIRCCLTAPDVQNAGIHGINWVILNTMSLTRLSSWALRIKNVIWRASNIIWNITLVDVLFYVLLEVLRMFRLQTLLCTE